MNQTHICLINTKGLLLIQRGDPDEELNSNLQESFCFVQMDQWVTQGGSDLLPLEEEHCTVVEVTEEDIQNSVKFVPSLSAVVRNPRSPSSTLQKHERWWVGGGLPFQERMIFLHLA